MHNLFNFCSECHNYDPQSIKYPQLRHFLQISTYFNLLPPPKLGISGEFPTPLSIRSPLQLERGEYLTTYSTDEDEVISREGSIFEIL